MAEVGSVCECECECDSLQVWLKILDFASLNCIVLRIVLYYREEEWKDKIFVKRSSFYLFLTTTITAISPITTTTLLPFYKCSILDIIDGEQSGTIQYVCLT